MTRLEIEAELDALPMSPFVRMMIRPIILKIFKALEGMEARISTLERKNDGNGN